MINRTYVNIVLYFLFTSGVSYADVTIKSPVGGALTFLRKNR